jgi:hypothetical protein
MRKISKARSSQSVPDTMVTYSRDMRPLRIPGATITSRPRPIDFELDSLFARREPGVTIAGALSTGPDPSETSGHSAADTMTRSDRATVSLSDGTRITFLL